MNLINLNNDCLHEIFSKLDEDDLACVSEVCKQFQRQAAITFSRKFTNKKIFLRNLTPDFRLKASRILRAFGEMLRKVYLVFEYKKNDLFFNAIIDKCGSNLIEIDFSCTVSWTMKNKRSKSVLKKDIFLKFPNLQRLRIDIQVYIDPECIEEKFPALEHLSLECDSFENANLKRCIKLNPQLKSLELTHYKDGTQITRNLLAFIDEKLPQLTHFGLSVSQGSVFDKPPYEPLFFKNLKSLHINDSRGRAKIFPHLSICNENIEEMDLHVYRCDSKLVHQICLHQMLKKLTFYCDEDSGLDSRHLDIMTEKLPYLSEVELSGYYEDLCDDDVIKFVQNSKHLSRFYLQDYCKGESMLEYFGDVKNKLNPNVWDVMFRPEDYALEIRKKTDRKN